MSYFPIFLNLDDKKILIIGGGEIATNKVMRILQFSSNITIISPKVTSKLQQLIQKYNLTYIKKEYNSNDLKKYFLIICAIDSLNLQKKIALECKRLNILYNCVDSKELSSVIFPSIIKKRNLTISFSTNGISPAFSKYIKKFFLKILPNDLDEFLDKLKILRDTYPKGKDRQKMLNNEVKNYFKNKGVEL